MKRKRSEMISNRKIILFTCFIILISIHSNAQEALKDLGLQASAKNDNAPKAIEDWGQLVGNWNIVFESVDQSGNVQQSFEGEWNWFYILNGYAIQDVFILPPRSKATNPDTLFYGVGIRIYDETLNKWESVWVDTSNKKLEFREASSKDGEIVLFQTNAKGEKLKITYFEITEQSFEWKQEVFDTTKENWIVTQLIHAKKREH